jgi:hypothetical protein
MEMIFWDELGEWERKRLDMVVYPYYLFKLDGRFSKLVVECKRNLDWLSYEN